MNFPILIIFTVLSLTLGVSIGAALGFFYAKNELLSSSSAQGHIQFAVGYIADLLIFYMLIMRRIRKPILHAAAVALLSMCISLSILYSITGETLPLVLIGADLLVATAAIITAYLAVTISEKRGANA